MITIANHVIAQNQTGLLNLKSAFEQLEKDSAYQQADISFTLLDIESGQVLFEKNKNRLLAPASTLKTITTASALHYLGEKFRYQTAITFKGCIKKQHAYGQLIVYANGDPSLGSDRFDATRPEKIYRQIHNALLKKGIKFFTGSILIKGNVYTDTAIHGSWPEDDIANYYGAGIYALNWKENQFEIELSPRDSNFVVSRNNAGYSNETTFCVELQTRAGATTEQAFAYFEKNKSCQFSIRGFLDNKLPPQSIRLAFLHPEEAFKHDLINYL